MKKVIITQTILNISEDRLMMPSGTACTKMVLMIFNKAMQDAGFYGLEYHNTILTELDIKE